MWPRASTTTSSRAPSSASTRFGSTASARRPTRASCRTSPVCPTRSTSLSPPRSVEAADAPAVAELLNEYSRRLYGEGEVTAAGVGHWWGDPENEAWVDDGAYADLGVRAEGARLWIDLRGAPSTDLLEVVERRAREIAA